MLNATVVGTRETVRFLEWEMPSKMEARMVAFVNRFCLQLSTRVKRSKLSGQTLRVQTGRLRRSVHHEVRVEGNRVVGRVGTNVQYGKLHEYGGRFTVPQHNRLITQAFGRPLDYPVYQTVKSHERQFPERSFLRSALREMDSRFQRDLARELASIGGGR